MLEKACNILKTSTPNQYITGVVLLKYRVSGKKYSDDSYSLGLYCLPVFKDYIGNVCLQL